VDWDHGPPNCSREAGPADPSLRLLRGIREPVPVPRFGTVGSVMAGGQPCGRMSQGADSIAEHGGDDFLL
jgi:hypothetical protein